MQTKYKDHDGESENDEHRIEEKIHKIDNKIDNIQEILSKIAACSNCSTKFPLPQEETRS